MAGDHGDAIPPIVVTMGCPAGIGPELTLKVGSNPPVAHPLVVVGDRSVLDRTAREMGIQAVVEEWRPGEPYRQGCVQVLSITELGGQVRWGEPDAVAGKASGAYVEQAARLVLEGKAAAMVTCPISKGALNQGGYHYPGHTEMLAALCGADEYAMMMAGSSLKVVLVTIHEPLSRVPRLLTREKVARAIRLCGISLAQDFGLARPRIGVAGLNPHGGEGGMFGDEEREVIEPAVAQVRGQGGFEVSGPLPPDTIFHRAALGAFDGVVAMYHDQGLIPFKLLHFADGVNVTIGLPMVRTSVDHGTAYDIAGKGKADPASLAAAVRLAAEISRNRRRYTASR